MEKLTREQAVDKLVNNDINSIRWSSEGNDVEYLDAILRDGFIGYDKFTNEQLEAEIGNQFNIEVKVVQSAKKLMDANAREDYRNFIHEIVKALSLNDVNVFEIAAARHGVTVDEMLNDTDYFYGSDLPWAWTTDKNNIYHMDCKVEKIEEGVVTLFEMGEAWGERHQLQSVDQLPTETLVDIYFNYLNDWK